MCDICERHSGCSSCPYGEGPAPVHVCKECGEDIVVGDAYYEMDGEFYHSECFEDAAVEILMRECGAIKGTAEDWR